jgi:hypothetical protein
MKIGDWLDLRLRPAFFGNESGVKFDAEDPAHTTFVRLCRPGDGASTDELVVSRAAMHLHTFGVLSSIEAGNPGFVSDQYLNAINTETSITALELCLVGLWDRVPCGYQVSDTDTMSVAMKIHGQLHDLAAQCERAGGHLCDPQQPELCARCGSGLDNVVVWREHRAARPDAA